MWVFKFAEEEGVVTGAVSCGLLSSLPFSRREAFCWDGERR